MMEGRTYSKLSAIGLEMRTISASPVPILSTKSFLAAEGTYESSTATLRIKQLVAKRSTRVVLLVDSSKFGQRALCKVLDVGAIHLVITDGQCTKATRQVLKRSGCEVIVAAAPRGR